MVQFPTGYSGMEPTTDAPQFMTPRALIPAFALAGLVFSLGYWMGGRSVVAPDPERSLPGAPDNASAAFAQRSSGAGIRPAPGATERVAGARQNTPLGRLLSEGEPAEPLSSEDVAAYVRLNNANAQSLLAAFETDKDMNWLRQAAGEFPDDPRVLFAVVNFGDDSIPGARREWLDRLARAAPENALVDYLSASEQLKQENPEGAIRALLAARGKTSFDDYTMHTIQSAEEMHARAGRAPAEAKAMAGTQTRLPHLQELRNLGREMVKLYETRRQAGDAATANEIAAAGLNMGRHMSVGAGNRYLINELVGIATEKVFLDALDPSAEHPFLDRPLAELQQDLRKQKDNIKTVAASVDLETMSDADVVAYFDRMKLYGEYETLKWFYERNEP